MVREAELNAEEDHRRHEEVETKNHADNIAYTTEKTLREIGDRLPPELRSEAESKVAAVRSAIQSGDTYQVKRAVEELEATMQRIGQEVYSYAGAGAHPGSEPHGDDGSGTVEGEFREV
jgi:molecular chaperone DnaK